ncbi:hypothetical protein NDU88_005760 [Pleurodeles waltl]|uniref:Uncharacterized protein n=1 Tax=Pleurodeles waltl TaxID=8319 RepID=A0AAV7PIZ0_PLEWA|nr:hypothetical protein NDU88_005760 [Pleurodeles waltl]
MLHWLTLDPKTMHASDDGEDLHCKCCCDLSLEKIMARASGERAPAFTSEELENLVDGVLPQHTLLYDPPDKQVKHPPEERHLACHRQGCPDPGGLPQTEHPLPEKIRGHSPLEQEDGGGSAGDGFETWEGCPSNHDPPDVQDPGGGLPGVGWALEGITADTRGQCGTEPQHSQFPPVKHQKLASARRERGKTPATKATPRGPGGSVDSAVTPPNVRKGHKKPSKSGKSSTAEKTTIIPAAQEATASPIPLPRRAPPAPSQLPRRPPPAPAQLPRRPPPAPSQLPRRALPAQAQLPRRPPPAPAQLPWRAPPAQAQLPRRAPSAPAQLPRRPPPAQAPLGHEGPPAQAPLGHEGPPIQAPLGHEGPPAQAPLGHEGPPTQAPLNRAPPTQAPLNRAPPTQAPLNRAPPNQAPLNRAPPNQAPLSHERQGH